MSAWFDTLSGVELMFTACAAIGGVSFGIWLVVQFVGGFDHSTDVHSGDVSGHADVSFKLLSFHGLASFFTMFGLVGLAVSRETSQGQIVSVTAGALAGGGMTWVLARLFAMFDKLQSSGTLDVQTTIGAEGTVYLNVPADGTGQIQVALMRGGLRTFDAVSDGKIALDTGTRIRVTRVINEQTLAVTKVE
jgi:hypothetical protein